MMSRGNLGISVLLVAVALLLLAKTSAASQLEPSKDSEMAGEHSRSSAWITMPTSLARFLFYHARPVESRQSAAGSGLLGYKRSSSSLDALTGMTLGKRASGGPTFSQAQLAAPPPTVELLNMDPLFGRQFGARSTPRVYDLRWDSYDALADNL